MYNLDMTEKFFKHETISVPPDSSTRVFTIPELPGLTTTYFVKLDLEDTAGSVISSNFYWLSTVPDRVADFSDLDMLSRVDLDVSYRAEKTDTEYTVYVDIGNPSSTLAFGINPKIKKGFSGDLVLPVYWQDNFFSLLPGEQREVTVEFGVDDLDGKEPSLVIDGWNIKPQKVRISIP